MKTKVIRGISVYWSEAAVMSVVQQLLTDSWT